MRLTLSPCAVMYKTKSSKIKAHGIPGMQVSALSILPKSAKAL